MYFLGEMMRSLVCKIRILAFDVQINSQPSNYFEDCTVTYIQLKFTCQK